MPVEFPPSPAETPCATPAVDVPTGEITTADLVAVNLLTSPLAPLPTILIVDDVASNLVLLTRILRRAGYPTLSAENGRTALALALEQQPTLILLDVMMDDIDGFEVCRQLKANPATTAIPVLFVTGLNQASDCVRGFAAGAVDYITKPYLAEEVLARVQTHVELAQLRQTLEQQVTERTAELSATLTRFQAARMRSIQSEKMASLGQLVAGVAHEINNPINFIYGNLFHAREYIASLLELQAAYQSALGDPPPEIQQLSQELDLPFLLTDLPRMIESMQVGTERIQEVVSALRNFSRLDEAERKAVDLHEGLESTLVILGYRLKPRGDRPVVKIIKQYGELPLVECLASQVNQIFMHVITNALDALEHPQAGRDSDWQPTLWLTTSGEEKGWVEIRFANNGGAIPAALQSRIFDPFFTTKPVGQGTGLGLSIAYQIASEGHGGQLICLPSEGDRAEFLLRLPVLPRPLL